MSNELLASKIVIIEEEPRVRGVPALATAVVGAVGVAERGPIGQPVFVANFDEFADVFGGFTPNSDLALAASAYFQNGGQALWVARTVHYTDLVHGAKSSVKASVTFPDRAAPAATPTLRIDARWDGGYANSWRAAIGPASSGAPGEFTVTIFDDTHAAEVFPNVSLVPTKPNYVESVINDLSRGSRLVTAADLHSKTAAPDNAPPITQQPAPLVGGNDGLAGLSDADFIGNEAGKTGLHALDSVQQLSLLIVPGRATAAVHAAMISYCEVTRDRSCFAILDPPANQGATDIVTYVESTAAILGLSEFAAIYWPRVKVSNPAPEVFGNVGQLVVPPSGHLAGVFARLDGSRPGGVYIPPAGVVNGQLLGVLGFETDEVLSEARRDLVFPKRINPLTVFPGAPRHIDGARTLRGDGNFPTVAERRGVIFIEQSLKLGLLYAKHQNNTEDLRASLFRTVTAFLLTQLKNGAFASTDPAKAFFVDFSDALNTPVVVASGQVIGRIGLATAKLAEFIVLRFAQDTRAIDAEIATTTGRGG